MTLVHNIFLDFLNSFTALALKFNNYISLKKRTKDCLSVCKLDRMERREREGTSAAVTGSACTPFHAAKQKQSNIIIGMDICGFQRDILNEDRIDA